MNDGERELYARAVLLLLRQVRAINEYINADIDHGDWSRAAGHRIVEIDDLIQELSLLAEIGDAPSRSIGDAQADVPSVAIPDPAADRARHP
jgi:hypothetical protein